jgi:hypothetical protein
MTVTLDTADLKQLIKDALSELMVENREEFQDLMVEALEDAAMAKAIAEGENSDPVDRATIF